MTDWKTTTSFFIFFSLLPRYFIACYSFILFTESIRTRIFPPFVLIYVSYRVIYTLSQRSTRIIYRHLFWWKLFYRDISADQSWLRRILHSDSAWLKLELKTTAGMKINDNREMIVEQERKE